MTIWTRNMGKWVFRQEINYEEEFENWCLVLKMPACI